MTLKAKELAKDIKTGMGYEALKAKYKISDQNLQQLISQLIQQHLISDKDIDQFMRNSKQNSQDKNKEDYQPNDHEKLIKVAKDITSGMSYSDLARKYSLSEQDASDLFQKLLELDLIHYNDMQRLRSEKGRKASDGGGFKAIKKDILPQALKRLAENKEVPISFLFSGVLCWIWITPNSWLWWTILSLALGILVIFLVRQSRHWEAKKGVNKNLSGMALTGMLCFAIGVVIMSYKSSQTNYYKEFNKAITDKSQEKVPPNKIQAVTKTEPEKNDTPRLHVHIQTTSPVRAENIVSNPQKQGDAVKEVKEVRKEQLATTPGAAKQSRSQVHNGQQGPSSFANIGIGDSKPKVLSSHDLEASTVAGLYGVFSGEGRLQNLRPIILKDDAAARVNLTSYKVGSKTLPKGIDRITVYFINEEVIYSEITIRDIVVWSGIEDALKKNNALKEQSLFVSWPDTFASYFETGNVYWILLSQPTIMSHSLILCNKQKIKELKEFSDAIDRDRQRGGGTLIR